MRIEQDARDGLAVLHLEGRFDAHEVPQVRSALTDVVQSGRSRLVVNLAGVSFIDSSGLASLVQGMKRCREAGGDLLLCELRQPVRIIFELTRLDKAFGIFESQTQALEAAAALD
jgi:anti-sigma B factor antagonist